MDKEMLVRLDLMEAFIQLLVVAVVALAQLD
jgi:hypothetical protein